jgi:hypothetical protein
LHPNVAQAIAHAEKETGRLGVKQRVLS